jgi:hypothetical protein
VRVDAEQEVLENQWSPALGRPERVGPHAADPSRCPAPSPHRGSAGRRQRPAAPSGRRPETRRPRWPRRPAR